MRDNRGMSEEPWAEDDRRRLVELAGRLREFLTAPYPADDLGFDPQRSEQWALLQVAQLREELRQEEEAKQRAFVQGQVCAYLTEGYTRAEAARAAGVRPETVSRWCRKDPAFAAAARAAEDGRRHVQPREHRRLKMTNSVQATVVRLLRTGMTRAEAAAGAGISRATFYTWLRRLPEFRDAVLGAEDAAAAIRLSGG
jgi:transposase